MVDLAILIVVGAIAFRGACSIAYAHTDGSPEFELPPAFWDWKSLQMLITRVYMFAALPIAFANGFLLDFSWVHGVIALVGTWLCMVIFNFLLRFNPVIQLYLFGLANITWLVVNTSKLII